MTDQHAKARAFHQLHTPGNPLVLFNVWDAGSATAVTAAGAKAIATGSWSVAAANGYEDGERIPFEHVLLNLRRIVASTALPVSIDLEGGYGEDAAGVGRSIAQAIEAGAIGCNLEDSLPADGSLREIGAQVARYASARAAADAAGVALFINARCDVFIGTPAEQHDEAMLEHALARAAAYADAGVSGLFLPGLVDPALIGRAVAGSPLPLNIMMSGRTPSVATLARHGVARVSHGPGPFARTMKWLEAAAREALADAH